MQDAERKSGEWEGLYRAGGARSDESSRSYARVGEGQVTWGRRHGCAGASPQWSPRRRGEMRTRGSDVLGRLRDAGAARRAVSVTVSEALSTAALARLASRSRVVRGSRDRSRSSVKQSRGGDVGVPVLMCVRTNVVRDADHQWTRDFIESPLCRRRRRRQVMIPSVVAASERRVAQSAWARIRIGRAGRVRSRDSRLAEAGEIDQARCRSRQHALQVEADVSQNDGCASHDS